MYTTVGDIEPSPDGKPSVDLASHSAYVAVEGGHLYCLMVALAQRKYADTRNYVDGGRRTTDATGLAKLALGI